MDVNYARGSKSPQSFFEGVLLALSQDCAGFDGTKRLPIWGGLAVMGAKSPCCVGIWNEATFCGGDGCAIGVMGAMGGNVVEREMLYLGLGG